MISVISRVPIDPYLNFCSLTSPTYCNSPRKCATVKGKVRQKAGYQFVTWTTFKISYSFKNYFIFFYQMKNARYLLLSYFRRYWFTLSKLTWKEFWTDFCMQNFRFSYDFFSYYNQQEFHVHIHLIQLQCIIMQT